MLSLARKGWGESGDIIMGYLRLTRSSYFIYMGVSVCGYIQKHNVSNNNDTKMSFNRFLKFTILKKYIHILL